MVFTFSLLLFSLSEKSQISTRPTKAQDSGTLRQRKRQEVLGRSTLTSTSKQVHYNLISSLFLFLIQSKRKARLWKKASLLKLVELIVGFVF